MRHTHKQGWRRSQRERQPSRHGEGGAAKLRTPGQTDDWTELDEM